MNLVKTSLLSLMSTSVKMLAGLVVGKAVAIVAGPSGLAAVGQFQNFVQIMLTAAKGGLDTGITKYTAEFSEDKERCVQLFSTAARLCATSCLVISLILLLAANPLSVYFLHTPNYAYIVRLFGVTICLFVLNSFLLAIINGLHQIRTYILVNIAQSVLTLLLTVSLIAWLGLDGALIALVTNQSLVLFVLLWALRGHAVIRWANFRGGFDRKDAIRLFKYSVMTTVSAIASPLTAMLVRDQVIFVLGPDAAGQWQAMWYIASVYLTVVTTSLAVYYLPKLSATHDPKALRAELKGGFMIVLPIVITSALVMYIAREWIVRILFTDAFLPMLRLFGWMLVGDVIKMASWLLSYLMLAKAMARAFIITEVIFSATFVGLAYVLLRLYGLEGVAYAYAANYMLYLACMTAVTRRFWLPARD
ncbi:O-antigen translocase [Sphingomonas sp. JC676]|uniref:O-antigen translocase n=1 Tax=Sphingomonas sp. JC676 TaxID=2768065 RepID=UPI001657C8ED|nr:O-antigen translocase [Sphingomonas sp. JC676]MBC9030940.1 O-antigen translocase [Sphingomonas sp. JC676]